MNNNQLLLIVVLILGVMVWFCNCQNASSPREALSGNGNLTPDQAIKDFKNAVSQYEWSAQQISEGSGYIVSYMLACKCPVSSFSHLLIYMGLGSDLALQDAGRSLDVMRDITGKVHQQGGIKWCCNA